jgi:sucrose-6-phosphate hydrolase SacC (GH32 family)
MYPLFENVSRAMLDGWNLGSVSSAEEVGWNMLRETFSSVLVSGNVTQEDPRVVGPARLGLRLYDADRYYLLISTTAIAIEGVGRTQPTAVADETTTVGSEYDVVGAVQRNQPATPLRVAATSSMVAITLPVAIPSGTATIQTSVATLSSSSIMMSGNSFVLVPDDASTTTIIPKEPIRVGPALIDVVPAIVTVRQGSSCVLRLTALAPWQSAPTVVGINVTVFGSALSVNATRLVLAPSAYLEVVAPVSAPLGPALLRFEPDTVGTALPGRRWVTVVAHDDTDPKNADRALLEMDNAHLPVHKASTPSADFRIKSDDSDRHRRVAQVRGSLESDDVVPATDMDALSSSMENDICTQDAPCVYRGRGCDGANIFEIGRTTSYTMAQCLALCRVTNGCEGFVFDAIANESKIQCKVSKLPADQACCLMKRACSPGAHKQGNTAVSFKPVPPPAPPAPPPAPPNPAQKQWCPAYHAIHSANLCDPSGPIQTPDGLWHIFDDCYWCSEDHDTACPWAHWVASDLLHWTRVPFSVGGCAGPSCGNTFHSTGSLSWTGSGGIIATTNFLEPNRLQSAFTTDAKLEAWPHPTIIAPSFVPKGGFWDPARALEMGGTWYVAVGSGSPAGAQVLLLEATNASLTSFSKATQLYGSGRSFVSNNSIHRFECPDVFQLGGKHVVMTSVEGGTQWMVGTITDGDTPAFVPETGGYADEGHDFYAGRTGAPAQLTSTSRRLLFGFNGWIGGVTGGACGRYQIIPRELEMKGGRLHIAPIAELAELRKNAATTTHIGPAERVLVRAGSHRTEILLNCTLPRTLTASSLVNISLDVLATPDSNQFVRYGYNTVKRQFFIESRGMATTSSRPQKPYVAKRLSWISAVVLVDGGIVESFTNSSVDMSVDSSGSLSNGAATTRSFLPNAPPFDLQGGASGRGVYLSALPAGVGCQVIVADLALQDANAVLKTDDESTGDGGPEIPAETPKPGVAPLPSGVLKVLVGGTVRKLALYDEVRLKSKLKTDDDGGNQIVVAQCEESQRKDCTAVLQGAFDRAAAMPRASGGQVTVMVPPLSGGASWTIAGVAAGGQWRGIRLNASHSDMVVILQPRAVLEAKRGSFKPEYAPFLDVFNVSQLKIVGYGAAIKMWRADYNDTAKGYVASEDRHGISVERSRNVHIEGLTVDSSGGDGLIIAPGKCAPSEPKCYAREQLGLYPQCYNITVRDCVFTRNRRQGMSVIGGVGVLVENTLFNSTGSDGLGTAPMAGVDVSLPAAISVVLL